MYIKKTRPGNAPGHSWTQENQAIEVEDDLANELLNIRSADFSIAEPVEIEETTAPEPEDPDSDWRETPETETPKRGGRPRLPRDKSGNIIRD